MEKIKYFEEEIGYICDDSLKSDIVFLINKLPDYFFEIPASSTGKYHPSYAISKGGLLKHTKVATKIAKVLLDNETIGMNFSSREKDLIIMALIIHDGLKKGVCEEKYTVFEHPLLVSRMIMGNKDDLRMDEDDIKTLCDIIESHMGRWNINPVTKMEVLPKPDNKLAKFVHMCDYLSSRKFLNVSFDDNFNIVE